MASSAGSVGYALGESSDDSLGQGRRSAKAPYARQLAMYLCYPSLGLSLTRVSVAFGEDRSTVSHACHRIEDRRDEPQFDLWIESLEAMARQAPQRVLP